jgi:Na+-transporting NADH:ubiquinone oxidoreductase subunit B
MQAVTGYSLFVLEKRSDVTAKKSPFIRWQPPMIKVLWALAPIAVSSIYFYGWRAAVMIAWCNAIALATEYAFTRQYKEPVSSAVFVTGTLFAMSLPPPLTFGKAAIGVAFGIAFGKMVFGGFGRNVFNPALTGRAFIYVCFGGAMTANWTRTVGSLTGNPLGGFLAWSAMGMPDGITSATPNGWLKIQEALPAGITEEMFSFGKLVLGNTPGCIGGTSAILVLLGGGYLVWKKIANWKIILAATLSYVLMQTALNLGGVEKAAPAYLTIFTGSAIFGFFFYATDPVSACKTNQGRWIYGSIIGVLSALITAFSVWPAGTMFSILIANMFAPLIDHTVKDLQSRKKAKVNT